MASAARAAAFPIAHQRDPNAVQQRVYRLPGGARLYLTVDSQEAQWRLSAARASLKNVRPLLSRLAGVLRAEARRAFAEGGNPGDHWQRLAPSTIAEKALAGLPSMTLKGNIPRRLKQGGQFGPGNILIRTGALRDSWALKNNPNHIEEIDSANATVRIGSKLPYAKFHQGGTKPYVIEAKSGSCLAFVGAGGETIFRRRVNHPGLVARPVSVSAEGIARLRDVAHEFLQAALEGTSLGASVSAGQE